MSACIDNPNISRCYISCFIIQFEYVVPLAMQMMSSISLMISTSISLTVSVINTKPLYLRSMKPCILRSSGTMEYTMSIISESNIRPIALHLYMIIYVSTSCIKRSNLINSTMNLINFSILSIFSKQIFRVNVFLRTLARQ